MSRRTSLSSFEESFSSLGDDQLRQELEELRTSTRTELLKSWAEIEELEDEKEQVVERNLDLLCELEASREREEVLRLQVKHLLHKLGEEPADEHKPTGLRAFLGRRPSSGGKSSSRSITSQKSSGTNLTTSLSDNSDQHLDLDATHSPRSVLQRENSLVWAWGAKRRGSVAAEEKERIENEFMFQLRDMEQEKRELIAKWETKLDCSKSVLESMEQGRKIQGETLDQLRKQLKYQHHQSQEREQQVKACVYALRKKLHEKRKFITKQQEKMKEYRDYINDLTAELEKTCVAESNAYAPESQFNKATESA